MRCGRVNWLDSNVVLTARHQTRSHPPRSPAQVPHPNDGQCVTSAPQRTAPPVRVNRMNVYGGSSPAGRTLRRTKRTASIRALCEPIGITVKRMWWQNGEPFLFHSAPRFPPDADERATVHIKARIPGNWNPEEAE